jgi:hypothetical protein
MNTWQAVEHNALTPKIILKQGKSKISSTILGKTEA